MAISLSVLMALSIASVAVITGIVCFAPTYITGDEAVLSAVDNIRTNLVTIASERLTAYFAKPRDLASQMQYNSARGRLNSTNITAMTQLACDVAFDNLYVFTAVSFVLLDEDNVIRCDTSNLLTGAFGGVPGVVTVSPDHQFVQAFLVDNVTHAAKPGTLYFNVPFPTGTPVWILTPATVILASNPQINTVWTQPALAWNTTSMVIASRLTHPDGSFRGAYMLEVTSSSILVFLQTLGLRKGGRALAWDSATGSTIGLSWEEQAVLLYPHWQDLTLPVSQRGSLRPPDNFTDPLVQSVLSHYGGFVAVQALPLPFAARMGSGRHTTYVDIVPVQDAYGLYVKILLAMPQEDFLEDVYRQQVRTLAGVCTGVFVMICLAFAIGHQMGAPLRRLAGRMELTASFDDNEADDPPSTLAEVASMQASYSLMKEQLNRARPYLPQSVVAVQDDDEDVQETSTMLPSRNSGFPSQSALGSSPSQSGRTSESFRASDLGTTRSSRRRTQISGHGATAGSLNLDLGLAVKSVTVAAFNLQGFNQCAVSSTRRCAEVQTALLSTLQRIVRENKGVIDYFQGDRVLASFNAVTNTVAHGRRAAIAAVTAVNELREQVSMPLQAKVGVSQGMALCGNMGTADIRRFSIVGHVVAQAVALERLTKLYSDVSVLLPGWMENDAQLELYYQAVGIVGLPGGGPRLDPAENRGHCILLAPTRSKQVAVDEWMYELKAGDEANPFHHVNAGFRALFAGDIALAKKSLSDRKPGADADALGAATLAEYIEDAEKTGKVQPKDLGIFYHAALLGRPTL